MVSLLSAPSSVNTLSRTPPLTYTLGRISPLRVFTPTLCVYTHPASSPDANTLAPTPPPPLVLQVSIIHRNGCPCVHLETGQGAGMCLGLLVSSTLNKLKS